jgi:predicted branched-subunit amino acid permease
MKNNTTKNNIKNNSKSHMSFKMGLICAVIIVTVLTAQWYLLIGFLIGLASSIKEKNARNL